MIQVNPVCLQIFHRVIANKKIGEMKIGDIKDVQVQLMSDKRVSVMGIFNKESQKHDYFYQVFKNMQEVHDTFTEQFTMMQGYSKAPDA